MRRALIFGLGLFGFLLLVVTGTHVYARLFRFRAERLLRELGDFRLERTPAAAVLKLRREYSAQAADDGPCSTQQCAFSLEFAEWDSIGRLAQQRSWLERPTYYVVRALQPFGLRPNYLTARLRVDSGKLSSVDVWFASRSLLEPGYFSNISLESRSVSNFRYEVGWPEIYEHPNLFIDKPSMCTGCTWSVDANVTWQASAEEFKRVFGFDLSCVTRFRECRTPEEFFPAAAQILKEDTAKRPKNVWGNMPCDARMAHILGRDSDLVGLVRVRSVTADDKGFARLDYELLKLLKGQHMQSKGIRYRRLSADTGTKVDANSASVDSVLVGSERIVLLNELFGEQFSNSSCAVMLPSPENLSAAQQGIADDRSGVLEAR